MTWKERAKHAKDIQVLIGEEPIDKEMLEAKDELIEKSKKGTFSVREYVALQMLHGFKEIDARGMAIGQWIR